MNLADSLYEKMLQTRRAGLEWYEDLHHICQQAGLKGKKLAKVGVVSVPSFVNSNQIKLTGALPIVPPMLFTAIFSMNIFFIIIGNATGLEFRTETLKICGDFSRGSGYMGAGRHPRESLEGVRFFGPPPDVTSP